MSWLYIIAVTVLVPLGTALYFLIGGFVAAIWYHIDFKRPTTLDPYEEADQRDRAGDFAASCIFWPIVLLILTVKFCVYVTSRHSYYLGRSAFLWWFEARKKRKEAERNLIKYKEA